jgi:hypothetical protein
MLTAAGLVAFIEANRDELVRRCQAKVAQRSSPPPTASEIDHGVPLFLEQMVDQLRRDDANTLAVCESGRQERGGAEQQSTGRSGELRNLLDTAIAAFEVLQTRNVGVNGNTGTLIHRNLVAMRSLIDA